MDNITRSFLSLEEASKYLGVSRATMYSYTYKKVLPYYKPQGRKVYFKKSDLENFVLNEKIRRCSAVRCSPITKRRVAQLQPPSGSITRIWKCSV